MSNLIQWLEIENYKCFEHLRVDGLKRVNLIGGDNNVGKTAFMEAGYVNIRTVDIKTFFSSLEQVDVYRNFISLSKKNFAGNGFVSENTKIDFLKRLHSFNIKINDKCLDFKVEDNDFTKNLNLNLNDKITTISINEYEKLDLNYNTTKYTFLPSLGVSNGKLNILFSIIQQKRKKDELNNFINGFDSNIEEFDVINEIPSCFVKDRNKFLALSEFGDGLTKFITIICAIWASENGALFIDEVENGIHYTKLDKLFEIIFVTAKKLNTQIFLTTHSKEAIEAFNRVQFNFDESDSCYLEFMRAKKSGKIKVSNRDRERLKYSLEHNGRFRGE